MAKRNSTRRTARKPKLINVEGHQLTEEMHAQYERCSAARGCLNGASALGLDDVLSKYRPSRKIKGQIDEAFTSTTRLAVAIGSLCEYPFFNSDPGVIRAGGCELLKKLALDLSNVSAKLTAIAMSVEAEETTKLQDWLGIDEWIARIGLGRRETSAEVAHG